MEVKDLAAEVACQREAWRRFDNRIKGLAHTELEAFLEERLASYAEGLAAAGVRFDGQGRLLPSGDKEAKVPGGAATLAAASVFIIYRHALERLRSMGPKEAVKFIRDHIPLAEARLMDLPHREAANQALMSLSGWVASGISGINQRLHGALATDGASRTDALHNQLPGTVHIAWKERRKGEFSSFVSTVTTDLEQDLPQAHGERELLPEDAVATDFMVREEARMDLESIRAKAALSPAQDEVTDLKLAGHSKSESAEAMGVDPGTVSLHRDRALKKLRKSAGLM